jgi:putative two-component system response regulator
MALADVFDAVTSDRPYKKAWPLEQAFELVQTETGQHFDPYLAGLFLHNRVRVEEIYQTYHD